MSFAKKDSVDGAPPGALGVILDADPRTRPLLNEEDRFGFPVRATLLEAYELRPELEALARDAVQTLSRLLGPDEARSLLLEELRQASKGKQANLEENDALLAAYDAEIADGAEKSRAARRAAEKMQKGRNADVESIATRIRRLVKDREERRTRDEKERARVEAWCRMCGPSLLESATSDSDPEADL